MNTCYWCGKEANYFFKSTKKWCCSKSTNSCPGVKLLVKNKMKDFWTEKEREKQAARTTDRFKDPNEKIKQSERIKNYFTQDGSKEKSSNAAFVRFENETEEEKEKRIQIHINAVTNDVREKQSISALNRFENETIEEKEKRIISIKKSWTDENKKNQRNLSILYFNNESLIEKENRIKTIKKSWTPEKRFIAKLIRKYTIEFLNEKYKFFSFIEDMRYNPDIYEEKEIQVHCKNSNCENSLEKDGWFTPTNSEIARRIYALEKGDGNDGRYFYCSIECKRECCLFNLRQDPLILKPLERYRHKVLKETYIATKIHGHKIKDFFKRSKDFHLDHKFSIYEGFKQNIDPKIIAHYKNLEVIPMKLNIGKSSHCSITLEELLSF